MEQNPNIPIETDSEENRQAYEQYLANYKPDTYTVTYGDQSYTYSADEIDRIKTAYRYMNADEAYSKKAYESYTNSDFDQFAMQNGLPSWKLWSDVEKYASGGGLKDNYGGVSSDQWKKINELWAKDWEYGLTDADAYRKANGLAPVSYDSMYGDTLLDAELKAAGLPPSKLLNGELGDKYRAWSNDSAKWTEFMDAVDRRFIEKTGALNADYNPLDFSGNLNRMTYTLDDALNETLADPQWAEFANAHYGVRVDVPDQYSDAYIMTEKDEFGNKYEVRDENGNLVYDTTAWNKDREKATKNNLAIDSDEFAITSDRMHEYYAENGQQTMALMAAEKAFAAQGKTLNVNTAQEFSNLWSDYYTGFSLNEGEGYTVDLLFPDANLSAEERAELQPFINKANRIRIEQGYEASREYLVGGEFSRELKQMNDDKIVAYYRNLGNSAGEGSKYYGKKDAELLHIYYEEQGEKYGMTPDEIAQMERGELTLDEYMHAKCTDVASAEQLADDMYVAYCKREKLPLTREELDNAVKRSYFNVETFINSIGSPIETAHYREQEKGERFYGVQDLLRMGDDEFDKHYVDERSYLESLPWKDYEQRDKILSDLTKEEEYVRGLRNHIRDITPEYYDESVEKPDYNLIDLDRRLAIANQKKLEFTIDAIAYTPEFAEKTADMDYVNQRFDQIIDKYAKSSADLSDVVIYATDDDKRKLVYLVDNNGETKAEKTTYDAVGESVVPRTVYVDALATDPDTYLNKILLHKWDNMARDDKRANTEMIDGGVIATIGSIIANPFESVYNFFADVGELIQGNEILSSQRATWSTDVQSRIAENISETWAGDVGAFMYQLIPSTVQSGLSMWLAAHTGGASEAFTLALMSTESYSSAVDQAIQNGASSGQAFLIGLANGANEALFEHLSLESFLKQGKINTIVGEILASGKDLTNATVRKTFAKELGKRMLFHGLVEGSEELNTSLANLFAESLILGVNSSYNKSVERYVQAGLSREEAENRATEDVVKGVAMDFVGGLVSGAFMTVGNDLVDSRGGRVFIDRTGMTNFVSQTHNLSLVKTEDALDYAKKNLEKDANGLVTVDSAQRVFDDLRKQGADAATLSRVRDSFSTAEQIIANQGAQAVAKTAIREQRNEDVKKLVKAASQMIYNKVQNGKGTVKVSEAEIARVTNEYLDRLTGTVQAGDIRNIELASEAMRLGYIDDIKGLAGYDTIAGGMNSIAEYYNTLSAEDQTAIKENAQKYINTYNHAGITGAQAGRYATAAAILEHAVSNADALNGLNSVFGSAASVSPQAVANACLNEDAKASKAYVIACCRALSVLQSQNGSHLFSAAQNNTNATAYVASQMALAASMPTDTSFARAMYDYIVKYGATPETMDLLTAANICESIGTEQTDIRRKNGKLYTTEQIAQITREYNKALTNYNNKKAIAQAHEQADTTERTEHEARIEKYRAQITELQTMMDGADSATLKALAGRFANATAEFQNAQGALETLIANQNQRDTQTKADLASAESAYNDAKEKYQNAMQEHAANYTQRMGDILEAIKGKQKVSLAALRQANALVMYGTEENLNDIQQKIIAAEKTAAVSLGRALGADVQCVKFDEAFLKERKIPKSKWEESKTIRGMRQGGTIYLNESVMKPEVGSLTNEVLLHEIGHFLEESADNYNNYKEFAKDYYTKKYGEETVKNIIENEGEDELVAEFTRQVALADPRAVAALCKSAPKMSMRVFQWLTATNNRMSSVAVSQSKIVRDAQRAFAKGIKAVRSENANQTETTVEDATRGSAMRNAEKTLNDVVQYETQKTETTKEKKSNQNAENSEQSVKTEKVADVENTEEIPNTNVNEEDASEDTTDYKFPETNLWSKDYNNWGKDGAHNSSYAVYSALEEIGSPLAEVYTKEAESGKAHTPTVNAVIAIANDVRQQQISPMAAATFLNNIYNEYGIDGVDRLPNRAGNVTKAAFNAAKQIDDEHNGSLTETAKDNTVEESAPATLPFELPEKAQSLIDNFVESKASHAVDGKVSPDTNETIRSLVKNQVAKAATAIGVTIDAETIAAYAEQYTLPEFETSGESWVNGYKPTETKTRVSTDFADIINSTAMSDAQFYHEIDLDYLDLARRYESGDASVEAELRKMVNAAAKAAGYTKHAYHGTAAKFNVFNRSQAGKHGDNLGPGYYFAADKAFAREYARGSYVPGENATRIIDAYLKIEKPASTEKLTITKAQWHGFLQYVLDHHAEYIDDAWQGNYTDESIFTFDQDWESENNSYGNDKDLFLSFAHAYAAGNPTVTEAAYRMLKDSTGYDGIIYEPFYKSSEKDNVYVVFTNTQMKQSDLVTHDNDGNIIPLSERFKTDRTGEDAWKNEDIRFYTEIDPEAYAVQNTIEKMTADEKRMNGDPRLIQTDHGFVVSRKVSREGLVTGNPVFNKGETPVAMIAPVSEFPNGDVGKLVPLSKCIALVVPNTQAYAETRTDAREMGVNVYPYNSEDPTAFDRAINRAAQQSNVQFMTNETIDDWIEKYGAKKPGAEPRVENRPVPERTSDTNRVSDMARNAAEAPVTTDDTYKNGIRNWITNGTGTYTPISNAKTLEKARGTIERAGSINQAAADLHRDVANSNGKATDLLARAELLYVEAQNPASGLSELEREEIFGDMCIIASDAGRALQAASLLKNMTAEGHIQYIEQVGKRMSDRYQKRTKERVNLKLTDEEKERYRTAVTEEQRKQIDDEVGKRFAEETSKLTFLDKIRNWRYFSMLGNPRTHFRNIVGNSLMRPVARIKDAINAGLQAAFGVEQADRTTTAWTGRVDAATRAYVEDQLRQALPIMQGVSSKYADEVAKSPTESNDGSLKATLTQEVPTARLSNGKTRLGRFLNTLSFINSNALELEDARALGHRFRSSMYQIIKARGLDVTNISDEQRESIVNYAMEESLRATFRDANALADAINKFARTNRATQFLTEAIIPFKKTPLNIAKRSIEYSPIGLVNGIYKLCSNTPAYNAEIKRIDAMQNVSDAEKAQMKQDAANTAKMQKIAAIDRLSQGLTGSLLTALGLFASSMGWISIGRKDDEEAAFEQGLGKNTYSLNIGDLSIDLSAFAPSAVPMLMGSALYEAFGADRGDGGAFVSDLISVLCESVDPVTEMSMLSGLADAFQGISYAGNEDGGKTRYIGTVIGNAMSSYVGQFIPTFVGQIARVTDPYARSYSAGDDYWASSIFGSEVGSVVKSMQNKIPFLSWLSEPKVDVHGNPVKNYTNWGSYIFHPLNNFILPATIKQDSKNEIDDELVRLYGVVDSADIFPTKPSRNLGAYTDKKTGQKYQFKITNDSEYTQYQMDVGQTVYDMLEDLMQSRAYARMTDEQKAEAIAKVIDQAQSSVKKRWKAQKVAAIGK